MIEILAIGKHDGGQSTGVPILADWENGHVTVKGQRSRGLLGPFPIRLSFLRAINSCKSHLFSPSIMHDTERITIDDPDDMAIEVSGIYDCREADGQYKNGLSKPDMVDRSNAISPYSAPAERLSRAKIRK